MKKIIPIFILLSWLSVIFVFSNQSGYESTKTSKFVLSGILGSEYINNSSYNRIVRKAAHMSEFGVTTILFYVAFRNKKILLNKRYLYTAMLSGGAAVCDELHQAFIPGRVCSMYDVCVDTFGIIVALSLIILINQKRKV